MVQDKKNNKQKIHLFAWALIICNALFCFCDSPTMGIRFYLPIFVPVLFLGIISIFNNKMKLALEHLTCGVLFLITLFHLQNSLESFGEKNAALFSETILIIFFFIFSMFRYNLRELKYIINSLIIAGTGFSILLFLFSFHLGLGHYTIRPFNGYYQYIDPNYLSSFMVIPCIILMKRAIFTNRNISAYILFFVNIIAVLLTGSRAAMLSLLIALVIMLAVNKNLKVLFTLIIISILTAIIAVIFLDSNIIERLFVKSYLDRSNEYRIEFWLSHILYTVEHSPIIGFGLTQITDNIWINLSSHSTFIAFFSSFGLLGFSFIIALFVHIWICLFSKDSILFLSLFISFIFVNQMIPADISYSFWGILLVFVIITNFKKDNPQISLWKEL